MKEISQQSLYKIRNIIPGQNYANIKARLDQFLPPEYSSVFSKVNFTPDNGYWFGEDAIDYKTYSNASAIEKEEIAGVLEECKQFIGIKLQKEMPFIGKVFIIPSADEIFWYKDDYGNIRVLLAQWGFQKKQLGQNVDIIDMLISATRTLAQDEVTVRFNFSDGEPAKEVPFILNIFNNKKECMSDKKGEYYIGKLFESKTFVIEDTAGKNSYDFIVKRGNEYSVTLDRITAYQVKVVNQFGQDKPNFSIKIDGKEVCTDDNGVFVSDDIILKKDHKISISLPNDTDIKSYPISHDREKNVFTFFITDQKEPPLPPPEEPKYASIHLLDSDGTPLAHIPFKIISKGKTVIECVTDGDGIGKIPAELLMHRKKYKVQFQITPQQRNEIEKNKIAKNEQK